MHELGVTWKVADTVEAAAKEGGATRVSKVTVQLGTVSAVVPHLLEDCWNWVASKREILNGCKLIIEPIEAVTYCEDCKCEYDTVKFAKICPNCGSEHTYLLRGNEFSIKEIEVFD